MRVLLRSLTLAVPLLLLPGTAAAHVEVLPRVLEHGETETLVVELPELRPGLAPTALELRGDGLEVLSSAASGRAGVETRWRVRVRVSARPGPVPLALTAVFADGASIGIAERLVVVPARDDGRSRTPAVVAAVAGGAVAAGALVLLHRRRR